LKFGPKVQKILNVEQFRFLHRSYGNGGYRHRSKFNIFLTIQANLKTPTFLESTQMWPADSHF